MTGRATNEGCIVAVLHDVVEDTDQRFERLAAEGFAPAVVDALRAVIKRPAGEGAPGDPPELHLRRTLSFVARAGQHPIGRKVKLATCSTPSDRHGSRSQARRTANGARSTGGRSSCRSRWRSMRSDAKGAVRTDRARFAARPGRPCRLTLALGRQTCQTAWGEHSDDANHATDLVDRGRTQGLRRLFGHAAAVGEQVKALLAAEIIKAMDAEETTARQAEARGGIATSDFSRIRHVKFDCFTIDRLLAILERLDSAVDVQLTVRRRKRGSVPAVAP